LCRIVASCLQEVTYVRAEGWSRALMRSGGGDPISHERHPPSRSPNSIGRQHWAGAWLRYDAGPPPRRRCNRAVPWAGSLSLVVRRQGNFNNTTESQMIVSSGLGFLVAVITFGSCLLFNLVLDSRFGEGYYSSHPWAIGTALIVGGLVSSGVGFVLKGRSDRYVVDEDTGERVVINNSDHSFFFIPMHWAGVVIALIGIGVAVSGAFK
jgi:hypothetical protein